jgi:ABC-2 type transport system ATP-binding protein
MSAHAINIEHFTRRFGGRAAVDDLCLEVPKGSIFGLLGRNGAGKSTTIKTLLNLIQPTSGRLTVLGMDAQAGGVALRRRVGYVPEEPAYYGWMTVEEILRFNGSLYPSWDPDLARRLMERLELPPRGRLRTLSLGTRAKVGLVMALGARPELLILDDPTSGLDPIVRREFLETIIDTVQAEGGTVFFSSHLLHEMERIADDVAILHEGKLRLRAGLDELKASCKQLRVVFPDRVPESFELPGLLSLERTAHEAILTLSAYEPGLEQKLLSQGAERAEAIDLSLEEIFVETVKGGARA